MPNATARKFGYPDTLVAEHGPWLVLVRPRQPTLGSLVLVCREAATAFGALGAEAFAALQPVVAEIERVLARRVGYERINYLMLMMVDPDVHFHVLPRMSTPREFAGLSFHDAGWPGPPALDANVELDASHRAALAAELRALWTLPPA